MEATDSNVLLLIAHPDDESMFFVPLLHGLSTKVTIFPNCVHVVCMTSGGTHREAELKAALHSIYKIQNIAIFSNEDYPDSPATSWDLQKASKAVLDYVQQHKIGKIYTFDEHGVSGHLNHVSCCRIANLLKIQLQAQTPQGRVYHLATVPLPLKYLSVLGGCLYALYLKLRRRRIQLIYDPAGLFVAHDMLRKHESQTVWYRFLFVTLSW